MHPSEQFATKYAATTIARTLLTPVTAPHGLVALGEGVYLSQPSVFVSSILGGLMDIHKYLMPLHLWLLD